MVAHLVMTMVASSVVLLGEKMGLNLVACLVDQKEHNLVGHLVAWKVE
jgi:hypothetical protein